jgi:hypothetical protein
MDSQPVAAEAETETPVPVAFEALGISGDIDPEVIYKLKLNERSLIGSARDLVYHRELCCAYKVSTFELMASSEADKASR